jgi:hypothetical protein
MACRFEHFASPWFTRWEGLIEPELRELLALHGAPPGRPRYHRKAWEWIAVLAAMEERGLLCEGVRALGFAVGNEPLAAILAARGVEVVGTDVPVKAKSAAAWAHDGQHAGSFAALEKPRLVDHETFARRATFVPADMRKSLDFPRASFDAIWSCCAIEHLGSLDAGIDFVVRAAELLKPGGFAFHTTEYNLSSDDRTLRKGGTVLYRERDVKRLDGDLRRRGACLERIDLYPGSDLHDRRFDVNPYYHDPTREHVKLLLDGFVTTSALLLVCA